MFLSAGGVFLLIRLLAKPYSLTRETSKPIASKA